MSSSEGLPAVPCGDPNWDLSGRWTPARVLYKSRFGVAPLPDWFEVCIAPARFSTGHAESRPHLDFADAIGRIYEQ